MMYKNILWGAGIVSLFAVASCDKIKDFKDTNQNQNQTTTPIPSALLTNVESNMGANLGFDAGGINTGSGLYAQYFSETQYTEVSRYNKPNYNYDAYYAGPIEDLQNIIDYNSDPATAGAAAAFGSNNNQIAIARILKAHFVKFLTDAVGDLPYFDALKGKTGVISAKYDAQQAIYADLLKELKEAVEQFDNGLTVQGDIIFGGDVSKWKKYANSLRLLIALNMRKADAGTGQSEFLDALNNSAGVISDNSDNVTINYPGGVFPHPIYNYYVLTQRLDFAVSETMTDKLSSTNDPRINVYGNSTKGFPYGLTRDDAVAFAGANSDWARIMADTFAQTNSSWTLISAANIDLARAEAAQIGWTSEDVPTLFKNGIQASFDQWGLGSADSYVAAQGTPDATKIATQEWLAFFPNGLEGWDVYRRTGVPALTPAPGTSNGVPRRATYGTNDYSYNASNVTAAAANYTVNGQPDSQWGRIWWDKP
ncbi:MAG TPA: SusD/RagB family nutrient-binding outer membrane lipoprotein [Chitinophagaceae bacterium]|jgi:SusD/RagB-like outer membrane lipoprotein|nr:SusD/RagB family nutrient-binding outer membrane lipoprotein [Chitinophagaceae bacterium]